MKFTNTFKYHTENPTGSVEQYARSRRIDLARKIRGAKKIYLDTNFWIWLRDARLGHSRSIEVTELLRTLETLVLQKKALCPLSVDTYAEVYKQSSHSTLRATLQLIDDLSTGVSISEFGERIQLEAFHFIREKTKGSDAVYMLDDLVWTKSAYVLGFVTPTFHNLPSDVSTIIQKAFLDQMWVVTLVDMLDRMGANAEKGRRGWFSDDVAEALNAGKFSHTDEYCSFKQLFLNELAGFLDLHKPMFAGLMAHIYASDTGKTPTGEDVEKIEAESLITNLIYHAFRLNKINSELPSFRVAAGLHAAIRWDPKRKYKVNDFHDIHHAVTAIPYCDWFFTEHSLRHLVEAIMFAFPHFSNVGRCRTPVKPCPPCHNF